MRARSRIAFIVSMALCALPAAVRAQTPPAAEKPPAPAASPASPQQKPATETAAPAASPGTPPAVAPKRGKAAAPTSKPAATETPAAAGPAEAKASDDTATDTPPAAPPQAPSAAPASSYPPPPPRWAEQPPIEYPFPEAAAQAQPGFPYGPPPPAPDGVSRRFSITAAIGPGALIGPGERALSVSYQVARAGLGLDRNIILQLSYEGMGTSSTNSGQKSWLKQDIVAAGLQHFFLGRMYARGGLGMGFVSEKTDTSSFSGGNGIAALAAVGYELIQREHVAMGLDLHASLTHYPDESWKTFGLQVTVSLF